MLSVSVRVDMIVLYHVTLGMLVARRCAVRARLLVVVAGCQPVTHVRYVHLPGPPDAVRAELGRKGTLGVKIHVAPEGSGSLAELTSSRTASLDSVATGGETYHSVDETGMDMEGIYNDFVVDAGLGFSPHTDARWRIDPMVHVGAWVWASDAERYLAPRTRLAVIGGAGVAIDTQVAFRPEVGLRIERQDAITRIDGRVATSGMRKAFTLAFSTPLAPDHRGVEASALFEMSPYGGVFVRGGYEQSDAHGNGRTFLAGYRVDSAVTYGAVKIVVGTVLTLGLLYLYALSERK